MTERKTPAGTRLRLVSQAERKSRRRSDLDREAYLCRPCSKALGYPFCHLVQGLFEPAEAKGQLAGGKLWWMCPRCYRPRCFIRQINRERGTAWTPTPGSDT